VAAAPETVYGDFGGQELTNVAYSLAYLLPNGPKCKQQDPGSIHTRSGRESFRMNELRKVDVLS
jgi:hypothetical protein